MRLVLKLRSPCCWALPACSGRRPRRPRGNRHEDLWIGISPPAALVALVLVFLRCNAPLRAWSWLLARPRRRRVRLALEDRAGLTTR